ncbi:cora-like Mg2+ transporter protein-domain-containing protein [Suillus fuscotomentosus]|uniref:Cora-like Mg2+ transporter protein-domain-containing protein n=1 Tax=Suillus fuscotomentosus TaxID=1912939 RepID=A0AAD4EH26_9AGAM|nr:cora-like Mg2+ transporter protein-domain-containing protein [Suillus fuscotomentosus]KAG1905941.1 cora-like Mg2+ transporter protein-domain-containing protein [Suillus fuscotomentosus]
MKVSTKRSDISQDITLRGAALPRVAPDPMHLHAAPSRPWPWMNLDVNSDLTDTTVVNQSWQGYPQNQFRNWTPDKVQRSKMFEKCSKDQPSTIYWMDVCDSENVVRFTIPDMGGNDPGTTKVPTKDLNQFWDMLQHNRPENIRVRWLFVDDLTQPVLRMLGTKYNIEPFFFTSSLHWTPSRYQDTLRHGKGDHITIVLPFLQSQQESRSPHTRRSPTDPKAWDSVTDTLIDIQAPFSTGDGHVLFFDVLAIHMVRDVEENTIISYHPESKGHRTPAKHLRSLIQFVGESMYWQRIFGKSKDPTFLFLAILWYALREWDESLDLLFRHVSELELQVLQLDNISLINDLHVLQARLLHYQSLLHDFEVAVTFIETTSNPAMESHEVTDEERTDSNALMKKECKNLLSEIDRLERRRTMLSSRLKNTMDFTFAIVNTEDSRRMQRFTYLTIVFLPASFTASIFGMNVIEIDNGTQTLAHYMVVTVVLTLVTIYIVVMLQEQNWVHRRRATLLQRAVWPIRLLWWIILPLQDMWVPQYRRSSTVIDVTA